MTGNSLIIPIFARRKQEQILWNLQTSFSGALTTSTTAAPKKDKPAPAPKKAEETEE